MNKRSYTQFVALIAFGLTIGCAPAPGSSVTPANTEMDAQAGAAPNSAPPTAPQLPSSNLDKEAQAIPNSKAVGPFASPADQTDEMDDLIKALGGKPKKQQRPGKPEAEAPEPAGQDGAIKKMVTRLKGKYEVTKDESNHPVISIDLQDTAVTDDDLARLANATNLVALDLSGTLITDAGLAHLKALTCLQRLNLFATNVTGAGLVHLRGLTQLRVLNLTFGFGTGGDEDSVVRAFGPKVDADSLKHIERLAKLVELHLESNSIGDEGLSRLAKLTNIVKLNLVDTDITDDGLKQLKNLTSLKELDLSGNEEITNAGLAHLKGLPKLEFVNAEDTKITAAALARYKRPANTTPKSPAESPKSDQRTTTEPGAAPPTAKSPLPKYFDQLGLSDEQKQKVIKTAKLYDDKIAAMRQKMADARTLPVGGTSIVIAAAKAIKQLTHERQQAIEEILTDQQRAKLAQLRSDN